MKSEDPAACLILAYLRPEATSRLIDQCLEFGHKKIYIAIDGPRNEAEQSIQSELILNLSRYSENTDIVIHKWYREKNLGLSASVISAIDWFFQFEEQGIILEDDLYVSDMALKYLNSELKKQINRKNVWIISGSQPFPDNSHSSICNYPMIWGWATWKDRWIDMRESILHGKFKVPKGSKLSVACFWWASLYAGRKSLSNSWAAPLAAMEYSRQKTTILPSRNLISNLGIDNVAQHSNSTDWHLGLAIQTESLILQDFETREININQQFENEIYRISARHISSPIKILLKHSLRKMTGRNPLTLEIRLREISVPYDE